MSARIGIVDSGIFAGHPAVGRVAGGIAIAGEDLTDHLGHGTAVAATIRAQAPDAELYAVKIFDRSLACPLEYLLRAIDWCIDNDMDLVNVSVATPCHEAELREAALRAAAKGVRILAPAGSFPGDLDGVIAVHGTASAGSLRGPSFAVAAETGRLAAER